MPVRISGELGGVRLHGDGALHLLGDALELVTPRATVTMALGALDGVRVSGMEMQLVTGNGVITVVAERALSGVAREIVRRGSALPEMTLSLRGLGARRGSPDSDHDLFFVPLLAARRRAERVTEPPAKLAAFGAPALRGAIDRQLREFAARRYPASPPDRRSLEAELFECAERLLSSVDAVERAAAEVRAAGDATRLARWREWTRAVRRLFDASDTCWLAMVPILAEPPRRRRSRLRRWLRLGAAIAASLPGVATAQHVSLRIVGVPAESLRARDFDVVDARRGVAIVVADSADRARLVALGWHGELVWAPAASARRRAGLRGPAAVRVYRSFDDPVRGVAAHLDSLARANSRVHLDTIGRSFEGRPILIAKVGAADDAPERPNVLFMATYHAREWAATEMALRLLRHLARSPGTNARIDSLVARRDVWILPVVNPDGYQFTFADETQRLWRKNRRPGPTGSGGVDLNRNHAAFWGLDDRGSSPNSQSEVYRGQAPESEPETRAVADFHAAHPPVLSVSYHTFGDLLLFPWGHRYGKLSGDLGIFRALAGIDGRSAVRDELDGAATDSYLPGPGWKLYETNGEYTDWAYVTHGTLAFTPELTSGFEGSLYYGFEFPDDESRLQRVFLDNLPFALDVMDAAIDPLGARPRATGLPSERLGIESLSPVVRVRVPVSEAAGARVSTHVPVEMRVDPDGVGRYTTRLLSGDSRAGAGASGRPDALTIRAGASTKHLTLLSASGAEAAEGGWTGTGFVGDTGAFAGARAWVGTRGWLRSPPIEVPMGVDSVSILFWTRYEGSGFDRDLRGDIHVSLDAGSTWERVGSVAGAAPSYYPERVDVVGLGGRSIVVEFQTQVMRWWLDEITVVAHTADAPPPVTHAEALAPSQNPVRVGNVVHFHWPFASAGEVLVYDFVGRLVWRRSVGAGATSVLWDLAESHAANGVYVVVARAGARIVRQKLYVARGAS